MSQKDTIAWECPSCGRRHLWQWEHGEATPGEVTMECDNCGAGMRTELVRIAERVWSATWPGVEDLRVRWP